tara:strand:+ start:1327 stop:1473 length:147 start_codon:yes stop_codon:yes gene_type:complete
MASGSKCLNCGATLSCGCQKRTASDGRQVCNACINAYEAKLKQQKIKK